MLEFEYGWKRACVRLSLRFAGRRVCLLQAFYGILCVRMPSDTKMGCKGTCS
jgi:hypothetical protein